MSMRRIGLATAATALLGSLAAGTAPAQAEAFETVCDPENRYVCIVVLTDPGERCPAGYEQVVAVPIPRTELAILVICARA